MAVNGTVSYLGTDQLGSVDTAVQAIGWSQSTVLFDPYGNVRYSSGTIPTGYGYTGQRNDITTGLDYYNARYYDPEAGQFASADSLLQSSGFDVLGLSRYSYVEGNPIAHSDQSGNRPTLGCEPSCTNVDYFEYRAAACAFGSASDAGRKSSATRSRTKDFYGCKGSAEPNWPPSEIALNGKGHDCRTTLRWTWLGASFHLCSSPKAGMVVTVSRSGHIYLGPQGGVGFPGATAAVRAGWIDEPETPTNSELDRFISGLGITGSGYWPLVGPIPGILGLGPSGAETWGNVGHFDLKDFGTEVGVGVGEGRYVGGTASYMVEFSLPTPSW